MRAAAVVFCFAAGCLGVPPAVDRSGGRADESAPDALARAAACLDRGDDAAAAGHLAEHVKTHPDEVMTRAMLAELLFRLGRHPAARSEFDRVVADAQPTTGPAHDHLVHCHTRLMQIAEAADDPFEEHLHRGIAFLLLVERWDADPARHDGAMAEATLGKAVRALREAKTERPDDPRVNLYLADAYRQLGQPSASRAARTAAREKAPFDLTPVERTRLIDRDD
jgi:tetratricopeptide (TPR) repeat protein